MRPIKFRAWDRGSGEWFIKEATLENIFLYSPPQREWLLGLEWMQFTGLLDKNGKEIYESDHITICDADGENWQGLVEWNQKSADYEVMNELLGFQRAFGIEGDEYTVIGNLYESN